MKELVDHPEVLVKRFWSYVDKRQDNECWEWKGSLMKRGNYGQLRFNKKTLKSHRLSFEINKGKINSKSLVCHSCGNSKCCNPNHLYLGNHRDNYLDSVKHKTAYILKPINPEDVHCAKINFEIAKIIRNSNESGIELAKRYGITKSMVSRIKRNLAWKI
jgi:hypothetical protein